MKEFKVKQDLAFVVVPLVLNLIVFTGALFMNGLFKWILILLSLGFIGVILWQSRPAFQNYQLVLTPKEVKVLNLKGEVVRKVDWKKVEAVAASYKKTWKIYSYSFFFKVKKDEDLPFALISREKGLTGKFQNFIRVFVRKRIPVRIVKA
ncbi:MAG: hypothetical protein DSY35_01740 [Desulfurobacterium sp.]|nr:MAG: hypothetical protein DSY35_01740 [Desulfurobacterium sp.]